MAITTIDEVKFTAQLNDEYTDEEILDEINAVDEELTTTYFLPKRSGFSIDDDYTDFFIFPTKVHEISRLQVSVETDVDPSGYTTIAAGASTWSFISGNNFVTLTSAFITTYDTKQVRVQHIPKIFNLMATNMAALNLTETTNIVDGANVPSPKTLKLMNRVKRYKKILSPKGITKSSDAVDFDKFDYISYSQSDLR